MDDKAVTVIRWLAKAGGDIFTGRFLFVETFKGGGQKKLFIKMRLSLKSLLKCCA
ncbi:MAG: hypothetical protein HZA03_07700 [Nitrospinae bacterium]|nr:hypothetical protein [Nitrospinota bacterium]